MWITNYWKTHPPLMGQDTLDAYQSGLNAMSGMSACITCACASIAYGLRRRVGDERSNCAQPFHDDKLTQIDAALQWQVTLP